MVNMYKLPTVISLRYVTEKQLFVLLIYYPKCDIYMYLRCSNFEFSNSFHMFLKFIFDFGEIDILCASNASV